jgi:hypothetical protein
MENNERGLYKLDPACGLIFAPNRIGVIEVSDYIHLDNGAEGFDGWYKFDNEEQALEYFNISIEI